MLSACFAGENSLTLNSSTGAHSFTIEIADTAEERAQGLMFRTELADDKGMLFDFGDEREVSFWMRNTLIPLDMIFIAENGKIANIHVNAKPRDPTPIPSAGKVRFVFEIAGGISVKIGLKAGDQVLHPRMNKD